MSIKIGNVAATTVTIDGSDVKQVKLDGVYTWCKEYTYTRGTLPTGVASLTCTKYSTKEPTATTGTVASGDPINHGDEIYWAATASSNYKVVVTYDSSNKLTVTGNVTGTSAAGLIVTGYLTVNCTNCTADTASGYYAPTSSKTVTFTANTGWSFGGSSTADTLSKTTAIPGSVSASPDYCYITIKSTHGKATCTYNSTTYCTAKTNWSGMVHNGATITYTADSNYAWDDTGTTTKTVTVSGPNTYTQNPGYGYLTTSGTYCTPNVESGWYAVTDSKAVRFNVVNNNYAWGDGRTTYVGYYDTTTAVPGTLTAAPTYCKAYSSGNSNCTQSTLPSSASNWIQRGITVTWTANSGYAFNSSGATTSTATIDAATNYTKTCTHGYLSISATHCSATTNGAGWYPIGNVTTTFTSSSNWAFNSSGDTTTTDTHSVPGTNSASANYCYVIANGTNCTGVTGWYTVGSYLTWTANTNYAFAKNGAQTSSSEITGPGEYTKTAGYGRYKLSLTRCAYLSGDNADWYVVGTEPSTNVVVNGSYFGNYAFDDTGETSATISAVVPGTATASADYARYSLNLTNCTYLSGSAAGWYSLNTTPTTTVQADSGWSFGGSERDTKSISNGKVPTTASASPGYCEITVTGSNCTITVNGTTRASGWKGYVPNGCTITWTANNDYAFDNTGTSTSSTTVNGPNTYGRSPGYGYYHLNLTNCSRSSGATEGWKTVGSSQTTYVSASTNYAFSSSGTVSSSCSATVPGTASASPGYAYLSISSATHCSATTNGAGWYTAGSTVTTTFTADSNYAFNSSGKSTTTDSATVPGENHASANYAYLYITANYCSATTNGAGWYSAGSTITTTFTADSGYAFSSSGASTTTDSVTVPGRNSATCSHAYFGTSFSHCHLRSGSDSVGWYEVDSEVYFAAEADSNYAFNSSGTTVTDFNFADVPYTFSASATHGYLSINPVRCTRLGGETAGWKALGGSYTVTYAANSNYAFDSSGTANKSVTTGVPATNTAIANYGKYTLSLTNCAYYSGNNTGWYEIGTTPSTTVYANANYSFGGSSRDTITISNGAVPTTASASPSYYYLNPQNGTGTYPNKSAGYYSGTTTVTWTCNSGYAFNSSGTTTSSNNYSAPASPSKNATYGYLTVSAGTGCYASGDTTSSGWKTFGTYYTTFSTNAWYYAFDGSGTQSVRVSTSVPGTNSASCSHGYYWVTYTNCAYNAGNGDGWYTLGSTPSTQVYANANYSFGGSSRDTTWVGGGYVPNNVIASPGYGYYSLSLTNCSRSSGATAGYYSVGSTQTTNVTANSQYAYDSMGSTTSSCSATVPGTASSSPSYGYYVPFGIRCRRYSGSDLGWFYTGTYRETTFKANSNYAFDSSGTQYTTAGGYPPCRPNPSADYGYYSVSCTNCTANVSSGYYGITSSKTTTFTANTGYTFNGSSTTTASAAVPGSVSATATPASVPSFDITWYGGTLRTTTVPFSQVPFVRDLTDFQSYATYYSPNTGCELGMAYTSGGIDENSFCIYYNNNQMSDLSYSCTCVCYSGSTWVGTASLSYIAFGINWGFTADSSIDTIYVLSSSNSDWDYNDVSGVWFNISKRAIQKNYFGYIVAVLTRNSN